MNSPYPYNVSNIITWNKKKSKKYMKALVYDFLKKKRKLGFYYDAYTTFHSGIKTAEEIKKEGGKPLDYYLSIAIKSCPEASLPDFFFLSNVSFPWVECLKPTISNIDNQWVNLMNNLGK